MYCIALYDYDATAEDELTFEEGQIIKLLTKEPHGVDDGWWEGELDGKFGNFPSLVVEECDENGEPLTEPEDEEDDETVPPVHSPPTIPPSMLPTDDFEMAQQEQFTPPAAEPIKQAPNKPPSNFEVELKQGQQPQSQTKPQFQAPAVNVVCEKEESGEEGGDDSNKADADDFGGGGGGQAQIVVTCPTPMVEEAETSFPECEPSTKGDENDLPEADQPPPKPKADPFDDQGQGSEKEKKVEVKEQCESDQQNFDNNQFEANFEAHFEANFEDAFGPPPPTEQPKSQSQSEQSDSPSEEIPKQVVGGRASIPDELAPHQLARLQNLKESNA
jgi:hypothetical protein